MPAVRFAASMPGEWRLSGWSKDNIEATGMNGWRLQGMRKPSAGMLIGPAAALT